MGTETSLGRRAGTVVRWPVGMGLAFWRYLWRTMPLHRSDETGSPERDLPPPLPDGLADGRLQRLDDGTGPLFRRRYRVWIEGSRLTPEELMAEVLREPNRAAPIEVAVFRKTRGADGPLRVGDEFVVRMPGPWDGPVMVVDQTPTSFRFATLQGHLEAGQIEFRARPDGDGIRFEIESWARSGDRLAGLLYDRVKLAKEMQLHMWTHFCERAGKLSGGRVRGGIHIDTRRVELEAEAAGGR
ncbi:MAG TPA: DUF1990 family protein [Actinomycetota bacterium]|nr:DUF1990 family protein [Actinomycetota bacterium]